MPKNTPIRIIDSQRTRAASFLGGSGSSGGGVNDHGLLLGLADDDHTQYHNDARGDLRYVPLTRTVAAGAGLTGGGALSADITLTVGAGNGITVNADDVALTTPGTLTVSSTNAASGSHTHAITSSSNPGAAARILASTSGGGLTLVDLTSSGSIYANGTLDFGTDTITEDATYLQVTGSKPVYFNQNVGNANYTIYSAGGYTTTGSISITGAAGDLTVGANVLFVDNSQANVGINMAPDPQFALDVNGPARATYFIGPHAIQLKNVVLLSHFDGRMPYTTNYSGEPNGHMGQVAVVAGGTIYRPGKFYKALQIAASGYNYCPNPSGEVDTTGWSREYNSSTLTAAARSAEQAYYGTYSIKLAASSASTYTFNQPHYHAPASVTMTWNTGETATLSCYVRGAGTWRVVFEDAGQNLQAYRQVVLAATDDWQRVVVSKTNAGANQASVRLSFFPFSSSCTLYVDAVHYEKAAFASPYIDGTLGGELYGHGWNGTAHASYSFRNAASLYYAQASPPAWTLMFWAYRAAWQAGRLGYLLGWGAANTSFYYDTSNRDVLAGLTSTAPADGWHHYAIVYDGSTVYTYRDGAYLNKHSNAVTAATAMYVGWSGSAEQCNSWIDDVCLLERAMDVNADYSCDELRAVYESNAPVFAETSTFSFRPTPKGLLWADDEGLWMKDTAANPVFGIYGGETYKNWGGFDMYPGDVLIGRSMVGVTGSAIFWDQSAGTFGFYGAGSATAQVVVATDGTLYSGTAGAQRVQLSASELAGYNSSNQKQWYGSTADGKFYSASGKTWIDKSGISILSPASADMSVDYYIAWPTQGNLSTLSGYINCSFAGSSGSPDGQMIIAVNKAGTANRVSFDTTLVQMGGNLLVAGDVVVGGDNGGTAGKTTLTNGVNTSLSSGTGTVKLAGATNRNSTGFIKMYIGATAVYVPYFNTITG